MKSINYYGGKEIVDKEILDSIQDIENADDEYLEVDTSLVYEALIDGNLVQLTLGNDLGSGGEGTVFECENLPDYAIKIYYEKNLTKIREEKIRLMVDNYLDFEDICWPKYLVLNNNKFVGFLMRKVPENFETISADDTGEINEFFDNNKINTIQALINICEIIGKLHKNNVVFCDIKFENFLINKTNYKVMAVDLDGIQVDKYPCYVASRYFNAPELYTDIIVDDEDGDETIIANEFYHKYYSNYSRDCFSFASLAFQLLMGQTPYNMKNHTNEVENLKCLNFPYSPDDIRYMKAHAVEFKINTWNHLPMFIRKAFYSSFKTIHPQERPQIIDWLKSFKHYLVLLEDDVLKEYDPDYLVPISMTDLNIKALSKFDCVKSSSISVRGFSFNVVVSKLLKFMKDNDIIDNIDVKYLRTLSDYLRHKNIVKLNKEYSFKLEYNLGFLKKVTLKNNTI